MNDEIANGETRSEKRGKENVNFEMRIAERKEMKTRSAKQ